MDTAFLEQLRALLGPKHVLSSPEEVAPFASDWTKTPGHPMAVALPRTTEEVSNVLKLCSRHQVSVVPSGGRTGLAAGAVPLCNELVVNLSKLDYIASPSLLSRTVRVGCGAITQNVHHACEKVGLTWPIDLASKGSCQVGGNLSTNAGGLRVIRYGMARKWVTSLTCVRMDGEILELNSELEKNNTGYDLLQLILGSEGTLAVLTEATLKLVPVPEDKNKAVYFFCVDTIEALPQIFEACRKGPFELLAFEFFSAACLKAVEETLHRRSKLTHKGAYYVIAEVAGDATRDAWLEALLSQSYLLDSLVAESSEDRRAVWGLREGITESLAARSAIRKHDLSVPVEKVSTFLKEVETVLKTSGLAIELYLFGHFGDGSPHVNLVCPANEPVDGFNHACDRFEPILFDVLKKSKGSISSEHGVGLLKKKWLKYSRTETELEIFRAVKKAFDPKGLLNPGKLFDL
jgi:FAD/FMN-containing dehydrogenase